MRVPRWAVAAFVFMLLLVAFAAGSVATWLFNQHDKIAANAQAIDRVEAKAAAIARTTRTTTVVVVIAPADGGTMSADKKPKKTTTTGPTVTAPTVTGPTVTGPTVTAPTVTLPTIRPCVGNVCVGAQGVPPRVWVPTFVAVAAFVGVLGVLLWRRPWV